MVEPTKKAMVTISQYNRPTVSNTHYVSLLHTLEDNFLAMKCTCPYAARSTCYLFSSLKKTFLLTINGELQTVTIEHFNKSNQFNGLNCQTFRRQNFKSKKCTIKKTENDS